MDKSERDRWLKGFVADLAIGGERVPLERVIIARIGGFASLRSEGLTWRAIAALITRAGGRRKDGTPITGDQLRAAVARRLLHQPTGSEKSSPQVHSPRRQTPSPPKARRPTTVRPGGPSKTISNVATGKDVSDDEIAAALANITKRK